MKESLDQLRSHRRFPNASDTGDEQGRRPCLKEVHHVVEFGFPPVEVTETWKVGKGGHQLLFHVL